MLNNTMPLVGLRGKLVAAVGSGVRETSLSLTKSGSRWDTGQSQLQVLEAKEIGQRQPVAATLRGLEAICTSNPLREALAAIVDSQVGCRLRDDVLGAGYAYIRHLVPEGLF